METQPLGDIELALHVNSVDLMIGFNRDLSFLFVPRQIR